MNPIIKLTEQEARDRAEKDIMQALAVLFLFLNRIPQVKKILKNFLHTTRNP